MTSLLKAVAASPLDRLRFIVLDCPYDTLEQPETQALLGKIAAFKIEAYKKAYPDGILPVDTVDFVGAHFLLVEETEEGTQILMGFKGITLNQCDRFKISFPAYHIVEEPNLADHHQAVTDVIQKARAEGETLGYLGSWTIRPELRKDPVMGNHCRNISAACLAWYCREFNVDLAMTFASHRFKVDEFHRFMGLERLSFQGRPLPLFECAAFFGEPSSASLLQAKNISPEVWALTQEYRALWDGRQTIRHRQAPNGSLKKAA